MIIKKIDDAEIHGWFARPVYYKPNLLPIDLTDFLRNKKQHLTRPENFNVDTSHYNYDLKDDLPTVTFHFLQHVKIFMSEMGYNTDGVSINNMWFNFSYKGDRLHRHTHRNTLISGAYYVKSNDDDKIYFHNYDEMTREPEQFNNLSADRVEYKCTENTLLLFKSDLPHSTNLHTGEEKITISFNVS
jgi:uncharacterized protein (TIGR02466 family)